MKRFVIEFKDGVDKDEIHKALYEAALDYNAANYGWLQEVVEEFRKADGSARMTTKQRDKLWEMCGRYNVPFREDDYYLDAHTGMVEGWVGGRMHSASWGEEKPTIYVGVETDGRSHT